MMNRTRTLRRGFSLVELLAVIAIIAIMAAVIGVAVKPNEGANLKSAQAAATSMFQAARTVASMRRTEARVIIYAGGSSEADNEQKFLRYMGVVYWGDPDPTDTTEEYMWLPANAGMYLPQGVYYIPNGLSGVEKGPDAGGESIKQSDPTETENISYPVVTDDPDKWYYYSFDDGGSARSVSYVENSPSTHNISFAGKSVVFASGELAPPDQGETKVVINNIYSTAGFVIRRIGGVLSLNDYDRIPDNS